MGNVAELLEETIEEVLVEDEEGELYPLWSSDVEGICLDGDYILIDIAGDILHITVTAQDHEDDGSCAFSRVLTGPVHPGWPYHGIGPMGLAWWKWHLS